ncbi:hypothetical protein EV192_102846 [Actinocrispum wychmicini]|uniref:Tetratricopeptide repeat protein n=2 Tax=Actinocrispum wychmicini TaxID=1213861 RepID=A0A4R2JU52_9PSEU|nr:hypothetical protein EV192_102846 [Actinocrispum wychmicini]
MTDETMEQVHEDVRELALTYPQRPLHEILGRLADTQDTVFSLLEQRNRPTHSRQLYYAADALAWLPSEVAAAEDYAGQAVAAYRDPASPDWAFGDQAGSHSDLAVARIMAGELEGATEALSPVLDLPPAQRNNGIIRSVHHVHTALTRSGLASDSRELQEHIEVFSRVPVASLPQ